MRNIRTRRRLKFFLIVLLVASFIAFFESRIEAFAPQFKVMAENRIEEAFSRKMDIAIGSFEGGIVRPFTLKDVKMLRKEGASSFDLVDIKNITSNCRIWDLLFPDIFSARPYITIDFSASDGTISGFLFLEGKIEDATVKGNIRLFGSQRIDLSGNIRNGVASIILSPKEGFLKVECNFAASGVIILKLTASHLKMEYFDITGQALLKNISGGEIEGELEAKNLIINYKPFNDIRGSYRISDDTLRVSDIDLGKICRIDGRIGLKEPHIVDIVAVTDNVNLEQTLAIFNPRYASAISGVMNSKWELKGPIEKIKSKIRLELKKGRILDMKFESLSADLKGEGHLINIEDSRITREGGSFTLAGYMDLARIGKDSFFENLKISDGESAVTWDGYDTAKWQDVSEFRMKKNIVGSINVGFKKFINDEDVDESIRDRDEYELSYNLHKNDSLMVKFSDNDNFFGLEHKDKF